MKGSSIRGYGTAIAMLLQSGGHDNTPLIWIEVEYREILKKHGINK